jgi:pantoate--beta-alanine ligase
VRTITTVRELRATLDAERSESRSIGLVLTMGYLHDGHVSLMQRSTSECDRTVVTIFVNPLQFAPDEDLATYPRDPAGDASKAEAAGVDLLLTPSLTEMYPEAVRTNISVDVAVGFMESAARPTHFDGVATVVAKLFAIVGPCSAYFGEKDFQQLAVVRRMVLDLSIPVEVIGCPTVREPDGLAMSSRNAYLTPDERQRATVLHDALLTGAQMLAADRADPPAVRAAMADLIGAEPLAELDYAEVVDAATLAPATSAEGELRLLVAARFGAARLLDNLGVTAKHGDP